jgi:hypothetical protein
MTAFAYLGFSGLHVCAVVVHSPLAAPWWLLASTTRGLPDMRVRCSLRGSSSCCRFPMASLPGPGPVTAAPSPPRRGERGFGPRRVWIYRVRSRGGSIILKIVVLTVILLTQAVK